MANLPMKISIIFTRTLSMRHIQNTHTQRDLLQWTYILVLIGMKIIFCERTAWPHGDCQLKRAKMIFGGRGLVNKSHIHQHGVLCFALFFKWKSFTFLGKVNSRFIGVANNENTFLHISHGQNRISIYIQIECVTRKLNKNNDVQQIRIPKIEHRK